MTGILLAAALWAAAAPTDRSLPESLKAELARVEAPLQRSRTYRTMLAENDGLERRLGALPAPEFIRFERSPRGLVYDESRLKSATEWQLQLATARALAHASIALPVPLVETEQAAWARAMTVALELFEGDKEFSKALAARANKAKAAADALASMDEWTRLKTVDPAAKLPADELDRMALFSALLAQSPDRFYEALGELSPLGREAVRLAEVSDFMAVRGAGLDKVRLNEGSAFTVVAGIRYPTRVVRAGKALLPEGGGEFAREAVGHVEADCEEVARRLRVWLKWPR